MIDQTAETAGCGMALVVELDEVLDKVWRAVSVAELRAAWLPGPAWAAAEVIGLSPEREIRYRLRDDTPPSLHPTVVSSPPPSETGGTVLRIVHECDLTTPRPTRAACANDNRSCLMSAA